MGKGPQSAVHIEGLTEFRAGLRKTNNRKAYEAAFQAEEIHLGVKLSALAKSAAVSEGGQTRKFAYMIRHRSIKKGLYVGAYASGKQDDLAAFAGAYPRTRHGWNLNSYSRGKKRSRVMGKRRFVSGSAQYRMYIGRTWEVGGAKGGPYAINQAVHRAIPQIEKAYADAFVKVNAMAFPDGESGAF